MKKEYIKISKFLSYILRHHPERVKIELDPKSIEIPIRSGMSVDVDIITEKKENVLMIPQRVVMTKDGGKYVRVLRGEGKYQNVEEVKIETGIYDSEGQIEITKGLKEGDKVITSKKERS